MQPLLSAHSQQSSQTGAQTGSPLLCIPRLQSVQRRTRGAEDSVRDGSMDPADYGIAAVRRGSYDDAAASLRPVSIDPLSTGKGEKGPVGDGC